MEKTEICITIIRMFETVGRFRAPCCLILAEMHSGLECPPHCVRCVRLHESQVWVLPDEAAASVSQASRTSRRRAMLVIDNEDGTWNVVYNVRNPDRVWQDDEDEEEDVPVDRLIMAKNQELQPSRKAKPGELEPEGLHVLDPEEFESQDAFGSAVEETMTSLLCAEAERAATTVTSLRDMLEFYVHGGEFLRRQDLQPTTLGSVASS